MMVRCFWDDVFIFITMTVSWDGDGDQGHFLAIFSGYIDVCLEGKLYEAFELPWGLIVFSALVSTEFC